jgi:hypothetical protein
LPDDKIAEYEDKLGIRFPTDLRTFLGQMNGTDLPTLNVYGQAGEQPSQSVGVYSYPGNFELVKRRIEEWRAYRVALVGTLADHGFELAPGADLMPIYAHRCVVCETVLARSVVLSVQDESDAIVYANSLQEYLEAEFLR